jgi:hypothetical protein
MLDSFFASLEVTDVSELRYVDGTSYKNQEQKEDVLERLDWVILKLHKIKDRRKYDYDIVNEIKNKIKYSDYSLSIKGVEYLNIITSELKQDIF